MFEPTEREVDKDVHESIEMFQRAIVEHVVTLEPKAPRNVLVALDGSSQDDMSLIVAELLIRRFGCQVSVIDARDGVSDSSFAERAAGRIQARGLPGNDGDAYEQILSASDLTACDLVIVPSPFGRDIEKVGEDSTGTVIDVLLARSSVPLLVIREQHDVSDVPFRYVVLAFSAANAAAAAAAGRAVAMTAPGGDLRMMLVVEDEAVEKLQNLLEALDDSMRLDTEEIGGALQKLFVPLHVALQKAADERGLTYHLDVVHEGHAPLAELTTDARHPLLVLGLDPEDHHSRGYVLDRIRHSASLVLVVPRS